MCFVASVFRCGSPARLSGKETINAGIGSVPYREVTTVEILEELSSEFVRQRNVPMGTLLAS